MSTLSTIRSLHQKEKDEANAVDGGRHGRGSEHQQPERSW